MISWSRLDTAKLIPTKRLSRIDVLNTLITGPHQDWDEGWRTGEEEAVTRERLYPAGRQLKASSFLEFY